ncbi:Bro-N domain-containing protein [Streptomyces sp. NPDC050738]|uniref:BRO-N domain-containing protein n=1 Tax=Streptomyces sp. NPDC050738 TaxID=3154744 RepID=UPI00342182E7
MDEQKQQEQNTSKDAIEIGDFVYAATGARVRRLTMPDGTYWFPMADVAKHLGYSNSRKALSDHVPEQRRDMLETVTGGYGLSIPAGRDWRRDLQMIDLQGLILLVNGCTKPECEPFKLWVAEVVETIQRTGSYELEPAPLQSAAAPETGATYVMPQQIVDALVRLEERNIHADELLAARSAERNQMAMERNRLEEERNKLLAEQNRLLEQKLDLLVARLGVPADSALVPGPRTTPQELLDNWLSRNLVVTEDIHAVAAYLAPSLVQGAAEYRFEEIAASTGLTLGRVRDCVNLMLDLGCMRQSGETADGAPRYVPLP